MLSLDPSIFKDIFLVPIYELKTAREIVIKLMLTLFNGDSAVVMFFLLSGCVLIGTVERDVSRYRLLPSAIAFTVRRFLRIYPAMFVCLLAMVLLLCAVTLIARGAAYPYTTANIVRNFLLVAPEVSGPTWTLIVEMLAAPFLIVAGYLLYRIGVSGLLLFLAFSYLAQTYAWLVFGHAMMSHYLINFALGCLVPYAPGQWAAVIGRRLGWLTLVAAFIAIRAFPLDLNIQSVIGFVFLSLVYHQPPALLAQTLTRPVSQYLGRLSYGVYLWHYILTILLYTVVAVGSPYLLANYPVLTGTLAAIPIIAITLLLADLSERSVERWGIDLGHRWSKRILQGPAAVRAPSMAQTP